MPTKPKDDAAGDEHGPNSTAVLESGRWVNGVKLSDEDNAKIEAEHAKRRSSEQK